MSDADAANTSQSTPITVGGVTYEKHKTHWYPHGNMIFTVQDIAFRLFKSFLMRRSDVMAQMLTVSQPNDASSNPQEQQQMFDGAPVVRLDDPVLDFALLLDAILPQTFASSPVPSDSPWQRLLGLAQIAHKYGVNDILTQTGIVLEGIIPTTKNLRGYNGLRNRFVSLSWLAAAASHNNFPWHSIT